MILDTATWITTPEPAPAAGERPGYEFRREFHLGQAPQTATLTATAHGVYEAFLNGERVGDIELAPGFTAYSKTLYVQRYDVAGLLRPGRNELRFVVSDGWFRGRCGPRRLADNFGTQIALLAVLEADGLSVGTDLSWQTGIGEIVRADLMDGQHTDLRRRGHTTWTAVVAATDPLIADTSRLGFSPAPPTRRCERFSPVSIVRLASGRQIVDFGQNLNGWVRLSRLGEADNQVTLTHGEALGPDGDLTLEHLAYLAMPGQPKLPVGQVDSVLSRGVPGDVFEPRHTTHGFRYAAVDGLVDDLTPHDITAVQVRTDLVHLGTFDCGDEQVNALHRIAVASWRANTCDVPTDCPQRERWGYTGDFQIFARSAAFLDDIDGFARKWLRSLADDQRPDGCITNVAPHCGVRPDPRRPSFDGAAGWGDACAIVPWELYRAYGDVSILDECWPMMARWVDYAAGLAASGRHPKRAERRPEPADHERFLWDSGWQWGEWMEPDTPFDYYADKAIVATAYLAESARIVAEAARLTGRAERVEYYQSIADGAADAWRAEFLLPDGRLREPSQANYVRGLAFGLLPGSSVTHLVKLIADNGDRLSTGFLSTGLLLPVLADHGHADTAYRLLFQDREPSWMTMIERGATTVWESWSGIDAGGHPHDSLNHYSKGAVVTFLHEHVAGLRPLVPGYRRFEIRPALSARLRWARVSRQTEYGEITVRWSLDGDRVALETTVPAGTTATVTLPGTATRELGPGTHVLVTDQDGREGHQR